MRHLAAACAAIGLAACSGGDGPTPPPGPDLDPELVASESSLPLFAGCGAPSADGVLSPGEWDGPIPARFARASDPSLQGTYLWEPTLTGELRAVAGDGNLHLSLRLGVTASYRVEELAVGLGRAADGLSGDELRLSWPEGTEAAVFEDRFDWGCLLGEGAPSTCSTPDTEAWKADLATGTSDGGGAIRSGDAGITIELRHPYADGDPRDVQVVAGQSLPLSFALTLAGPCPGDERFTCWYQYHYPGDYGSRDVLLGCNAPPPDQQLIDVQIGTPRGPLRVIDFRAESAVPAALMGSATLDVTRIDLSALYLDGAPVQPGDAGTVQDVNGDGIDDLVVHFRSGDLIVGPSHYANGGGGIGAVDRELTLAGRTRTGRRFYGVAGIQLIYP